MQIAKPHSRNIGLRQKLRRTPRPEWLRDNRHERSFIPAHALRQGAAHDPIVASFVWRNGRYALTSRGGEGFGDITIHRFEGPDLIVQSIRPDLAAEYAIARKFADGTYLVVPIDETDADESIRKEFCSRESGASCRVATSGAVIAFARATGAMPHAEGAASRYSWRLA